MSTKPTVMIARQTQIKRDFPAHHALVSAELRKRNKEKDGSKKS